MSKQIFVRAKEDGEEILLLNWKQWNPGLSNDEMTLEDVISTLPAAPPSAIPEEIKILENPESPWAFPGAVNLERHDCIHVMLGRGLLPEDEAFVIGFTMGAASGIQDWQYSMFRTLAVHWYPKPYNFREEDLLSFELGFDRGKRSRASDIHEFPFEKFMDLTVGELRSRLGINTNQLRSIYRTEQLHRPDSNAARRLDVCKSVDDSAIAKPTGEDAPKKEGTTK